MSIKVLDPSIYKKGSRFELKKINQIDTVTYSEFSEDIEEYSIGNQDITSVKIGNSTVTLPVRSTSFFCNKGYIMEGKGLTSYYNNGPYVFSKGIAGFLGADIEIIIEVSDPVNNIEIDLTFSGIEKEYNSTNFDEYKGLDNLDGNHLDWDSDDIINLINTNSSSENTWTGDSNYVIYGDDEINIAPYVKSVLPANGSDPDAANLPNASDIITKWTGGSGQWWSSAEYARWRTVQWYDKTKEYGGQPIGTCAMWPASFYTKGAGAQMERADQRINKIIRYPVKYRKEIIKIDDYHYKLVMNLPVKYVYSCATKYDYTTFLVEHNAFLEGKMFYDLVSNINVDLKGYRILGTSNEHSYSLNLDENGDVIVADPLTDQVIDVSVFKIPTSNFININTTVNGVDWKDKWLPLILEKYRAGKYLVNLEVDARWCLENDIQIDSEVVVKLLTGEYLDKVTDYDIQYFMKQGSTIEDPILGREYLISSYGNQKPFEVRGSFLLNVYTRGSEDVIIPVVDTDIKNVYIARILFDSLTQKIYLYIQDSEGQYTLLKSYNYSSNYIFGFVYENNIQFRNYDYNLIDYNSDNLIDYNEDNLVVEGDDLNELITANGGNYKSQRYVNIQRKICVFKVKNIERTFSKEGFIYNLSLLEDHTTEVN